MTTGEFTISVAVLGGLLAAPSALWGQAGSSDCQFRALKTVREARIKASTGATSEAKALLEQADRECGTSPLVMKGISEGYEKLGFPELAATYAKNAALSLPAASPGASHAPAARAKGYVRDKFALVVGIGSFKQKDKIRALKYAAKDARDFAAALLDPHAGRFPAVNVTVLTDEQATTTAIKSALGEIAAKAKPGDLVILYFSTHGSSPSSNRSKIAASFLITHDTETSNLFGTAYGMNELANYLRQNLFAERVVTFLDTCYSGDTTRILEDSKGLEVDTLSDASIGRVAQGKGSVVITSSTNQQLSWESDEQQSSFFTLQLIKAMKQRDGLMNIQQIYTDLERNVPDAVRKYTKAKKLGDGEKGAAQTPVIYPIRDVPDIVIGTPVQ